jgi:hypothetical protein
VGTRRRSSSRLTRGGADDGRGHELMTIDVGDIGPYLDILRDPPAVDQPDDVPAPFRRRLPIKKEGRHDHVSRSPSQLIRQERVPPDPDSGGVDDQRRETPDVACQVDELVVQRDVLRPRPGHAGDDVVRRKS